MAHMGQSTREAMILAAERLFAENGLDGVSLREIAAAAGQRNNSAAQYHFGSKQGLVDAVFEYRMERIDQRRRAMLAALDGAGRGQDLRELLEAFVHPLAEHIGHEDGVSWYARFLVRVATDPWFDVFAPPRDRVTRGLATVVDRLEVHLADVPEPLRSTRLRLGFGLVVHAMADQEVRLADHRPAWPTAMLTANVVDMLQGCLTAAVSEDSGREAAMATRRTA